MPQPPEDYSQLFQGGGNPALGAGAGAVQGALSVLGPLFERRMAAQDRESFLHHKETSKAIAARIEEMRRFEMLASSRNQPVQIFDPTRNKDHEAVSRFVLDGTPMPQQAYDNFFNTPIPWETVLMEEDVATPPPGGHSLVGKTLDPATPSYAPPGAPTEARLADSVPQPLAPPVPGGAPAPANPAADPTDGNMYGNYDPAAVNANMGAATKLSGRQAPPQGSPLPTDAKPFHVTFPPGQDPYPDAQPAEPAQETGQFQGPMPGTVDTEANKSLFSRFRDRGFSIEVKKGIKATARTFKEMTDRRADTILTKVARGVPWSEAIEGASPAAIEAAKKIAPDIRRSLLASQGFDLETIEQDVLRTFGIPGKISEYREKAQITTEEAYPRAEAQQRAQIRAAGPKAFGTESGRRDARLLTPLNADERFARSAQEQGLEPGTPAYDQFIADRKAAEASTIAQEKGNVEAQLKLKYGESEFANVVREYGLTLPLSPEDSALVRVTLERSEINRAAGKAREVGEQEQILRKQFEEWKAKLDKQYSSEKVDRVVNEFGFTYPLTPKQQRAVNTFLDRNEVKQAEAKAEATTTATETAREPFTINRETREAKREEGINARELTEDKEAEARRLRADRDAERRKLSAMRASERRENTEFRRRSLFSSQVGLETDIEKKKKLDKIEARKPLKEERTYWFTREEGKNPPAMMTKEAANRKGLIKLDEKGRQYILASKRMARQFRALRAEFNRFFTSESPAYNWASAKVKGAADLKRSLETFDAQIGDFAQAYGGEGRRLTEQDRVVFRRALGLDTDYISPREANRSFDNIEIKLASDIGDYGFKPSAVGLSNNIRLLPRTAPTQAVEVGEALED